jgi:hypothetical protein
MKMLKNMGSELSRRHMKYIRGGVGGSCCAHEYGMGVNIWICGLSKSDAQSLANVMAETVDPGGTDPGTGGAWCCASCPQF